MPSASSRCAISPATLASPSITGMMGWPAPASVKPAADIPHGTAARCVPAAVAARGSPAAGPGRAGGGGDGRRERVAEQVRARALAQPVDDLLATAGVAAAGAAQRLAQRAGDDVDPAHHIAVFVRAAAGGTDEPDGMRVVDHHHCVVTLGEVADGRQVRDHTVHREHAVGGDEPVAGAGRVAQALLELHHVVAIVEVVVAHALRLAEADAVDDAGVVQAVADDAILLVEDGLEQAAVGVEARRVEDGVVGAQERTERGLQLLVHGLRAADEPHRRHAVAVARRVRAWAASMSAGWSASPR
jgi:hypothetical protein